MTKAHRHHHTDGMAPCCGDFWIFGKHWARTHRSGRGLDRGSRLWLTVRRSGRGCVPSVRPAAGGVEAPADARRPFRADATWTAARRNI